MDSENKQRYTVIISDEAAQMLVSHARFLAQVSESAALRLIEVFNERVKEPARIYIHPQVPIPSQWDV
jgi:hypothetical protein